MENKVVINENHEAEHLKNVLESARQNAEVVKDQLRSLEGVPEIEAQVDKAINLIDEELKKLG